MTTGRINQVTIPLVRISKHKLVWIPPYSQPIHLWKGISLAKMLFHHTQHKELHRFISESTTCIGIYLDKSLRHPALQITDAICLKVLVQRHLIPRPSLLLDMDPLANIELNNKSGSKSPSIVKTAEDWKTDICSPSPSVTPSS